MDLKVLTKEAKDLFPKLFQFRDDFYLAGGTTLALQVGHRLSVDFDLFSDNPIKKTLLKKIEEVFSQFKQEVLVNNQNEFTILINNIKFSFLHYPFPPILPLVQDKIINLLSFKEILATKAYTIGRRGEFKDYVDLYVCLKDDHGSLTEIINLAQKKYGDVFNDRLFLEQLVYLSDLSETPLIMMDQSSPSKETVLKLFSEKISEFKNKF